MTDFVLLVSARLGAPLQSFHENPTKKLFGLNDLPAKTQRLLDEVSAGDMELYTEASERFAKDWDREFGTPGG